ncbi:MAG: hypothetical protein KC656_32775, partial [Myxococcales bacterium]|nr:hypothetical protein [Myxococcales bacterium]
MVLLTGLALAHDPSPAAFIPSTAPNAPEVEVLTGTQLHVVGFDVDTATRLGVSARVGRFAVGGTGLFTMGYRRLGNSGSVWGAFAVVDRPWMRAQLFLEAGPISRTGLSVVARAGRGIDGQGVQVDFAWGVGTDVRDTHEPTWGGPIDRFASTPEGGVSFGVHPRGTQALRVGFVGTAPVVGVRVSTVPHPRVGLWSLDGG